MSWLVPALITHHLQVSAACACLHQQWHPSWPATRIWTTILWVGKSVEGPFHWLCCSYPNRSMISYYFVDPTTRQRHLQICNSAQMHWNRFAKYGKHGLYCPVRIIGIQTIFRSNSGQKQMMSSKFHIRTSSSFLDLQTIRTMSLVVTNRKEREISMLQKRHGTIQAAMLLRLTVKRRTKRWLVSESITASNLFHRLFENYGILVNVYVTIKCHCCEISSVISPKVQ